jgi:rare lipoprotein A
LRSFAIDYNGKVSYALRAICYCIVCANSQVADQITCSSPKKTIYLSTNFFGVQMKLVFSLMVALFAGVAFAQAPTAPAAAPAPAAKPAEMAKPAAAPAAAPAPASMAPKTVATSGDAMEGAAAWYGKKFAGRRTASGQRFNPNMLTAAHNTLPFGSKVRVTNTKNNRSVVVVINDRGPTAGGRIIDLSRAAAKKLGYVRAGTAPVKLEVVGQTKLKGAGHKGKKGMKKAKRMVKKA